MIVTDLHEAAGTATAVEIGARFIRLDVSEEAASLHLAERVPAADVVVNNAGITGFESGQTAHDPEHASLEDWRTVHRVNLDGTFLGCRYAIGAMKARGTGSIINISSRAGLVGIPRAAAYRVLQGGNPQSYQDRRSVLRAAWMGDPLQRDPPGCDPDADLGADVGERPRPGGAHGGAGG